MLEHLFGSKTRLKLLRFFFRHSDRPYFVRELARELGVQVNAIRRELELLVLATLIKEVAAGEKSNYEHGSNLRKYYILNEDSLLTPELQALLLKAQLLGEQKFINEVKDRAGEIKLFLLTGQFTGDTRTNSDLLLVGEIKERVVDKIVTEYEKEFGFEIRYTIMSEKELLDRRRMMDKFLYALFEANNVKVIDKFNI
ncbi:MAG: polymerase beta domain protein region protein [Candidatus Magasanikbacteria bacterium GW2011_GWC2_37_14]|uniref:Polymerase beta domain protein region protein n=1 Tax=Candidatus Magasanikbacteria bacterium GW2011_GWC2_37_14 TaxID=1619046 RepID=A0A0G0G9C5_9BACT|nr:MAG: polymerase beta domain protein region protein [Candidatus Magasanikbacteria bacterium GW2011_GWC2_37_14]